jgi:GNAT superfamily N-acetyltransferase
VSLPPDTVEIIDADYCDPRHAGDIAALLNSYACDPMGGGAPLSGSVLASLADELSRRADAFSVLCYVNDRAAGLVNCFEGFSTFKCRPLFNVHDVVVLAEYRGRRISQRMLTRVEEIARQRGCCKLTLEVLERNHPAREAYRRFGFAGYQLDPVHGRAEFWEKPLE